MSEYGMGFAACEKPMGASGRYGQIPEAFSSGDDGCIREGATVYAVKEQ